MTPAVPTSRRAPTRQPVAAPRSASASGQLWRLLCPQGLNAAQPRGRQRGPLHALERLMRDLGLAGARRGRRSAPPLLTRKRPCRGSGEPQVHPTATTASPSADSKRPAQRRVHLCHWPPAMRRMNVMHQSHNSLYYPPFLLRNFAHEFGKFDLVRICITWSPNDKSAAPPIPKPHCFLRSYFTEDRVPTSSCGACASSKDQPAYLSTH